MGSVNLSGLWIPHLFNVAVICSYQTIATRYKHCIYNTPKALIDGFHSFYSSFKNTTMTNHVPVSIITYNQVMIGT